MKTKNSLHAVSFQTQSPPPAKDAIDSREPGVVGRRAFLRKMGLAGASLAPVSALFLEEGKAMAREPKEFKHGLSQGDVDILRFVAAAEILETDFWVQYTELAKNNPGFGAALMNLDSDMVQYVADNTDDEDSHQKFLNAFLVSVGAKAVNLERFRTLPGSTATGSTGRLRLTNLMHLNVDTSWWTRYRSTENPDFGNTFPQAVNIVNRQAIPISNSDAPPTAPPTTHMQAIANTAAFHFATIEQGGSSLYGSLIPKATSLVVLRILYAIGGSEVAHFQTWSDKAGAAVSPPLAPLTDNTLTFHDLNSPPFGGEAFSTNLIMPEPCDFIRESLPDCAIIRPTLAKNAGPLAVVAFLTDQGLFTGQSAEFFKELHSIAKAANSARRDLEEAEEMEEGLEV
jgi:Ferritin-like domain